MTDPRFYLLGAALGLAFIIVCEVWARLRWDR